MKSLARQREKIFMVETELDRILSSTYRKYNNYTTKGTPTRDINMRPQKNFLEVLSALQ
jgi:hypothetical protein